ncbi:hypothetical protein [Streptomyces sp. FL07-04A]|uniref:hypothetical protein n=1 Tax=Streptomyces sp. FL07-04A TaxID=3028658 RepID=UPI0029BAE55B|nr:hypothetical protein [Streptomyces sp. FL07-04A]MDX3579761.1 hypothetical protein [Streptomyces sp. FL07-04A]
MHDLIRRSLAWLRLLFMPGTGKRRRTRHHPYLCLHLTAVRRTAASPVPHLPFHRSPYGLPTALDGADSALVVLSGEVVDG